MATWSSTAHQSARRSWTTMSASCCSVVATSRDAPRTPLTLPRMASRACERLAASCAMAVAASAASFASCVARCSEMSAPTPTMPTTVPSGPKGAPGAAHPMDAAVGMDYPVLDVVVPSRRNGLLDRGKRRLDIVGVKQGEVTVERAVEHSRLETEHPRQLVVPVHPVGGDVPVPGAHPAGLQGEFVSLDPDGRGARGDAARLSPALHAHPLWPSPRSSSVQSDSSRLGAWDIAWSAQSTSRRPI